MKLLAFDLDGTLLTSNQEIAESSLKAIREFIDKGNKMCIVSGRNYDIVKPIVDTYHLHCDLLLNNGHQYISSDDKVKKEIPMDQGTSIKILEILLNYNFHFALHTDQGKYIFADKDQFFNDHIAMAKKKRNGTLGNVEHAPLFVKKFFLANTHQVHTIDEFIASGAKILKIDARNFDQENLKAGKAQILAISSIAIHSSFEAFLEITSKDANKATLLNDYANEIGVDHCDIYVFGDSMNDLELFESFPNSIAMGNSSQPILKLAKWITDTNDNDGIYKAIETHIN